MEHYTLANAKQFRDTMHCLIAEWGSEHFKLLLPRSWAELTETSFLRTDFQYVTDDNVVVVIVGTGDVTFRREFRLAPHCFSKQEH